MPRVILAAALCAGLAACSLPQLAATGTRAALSEQTAAKITGLCQHAQPLLGLAGLVPSATVHEVAGFVSSYCSQMLLTGQLPPTTDTNTENWLLANLGTLRALLGR